MYEVEFWKTIPGQLDNETYIANRIITLPFPPVHFPITICFSTDDPDIYTSLVLAENSVEEIEFFPEENRFVILLFDDLSLQESSERRDGNWYIRAMEETLGELIDTGWAVYQILPQRTTQSDKPMAKIYHLDAWKEKTKNNPRGKTKF